MENPYYFPPRTAYSAPYSKLDNLRYRLQQTGVEESTSLPLRSVYSAPHSTLREDPRMYSKEQTDIMEHPNPSPKRVAYSAPHTKERSTRYRRDNRILQAFPGWLHTHSPYRISNRQAQRRFHSEPPHNVGRSQGQGSGSLPAAPRNRPNVARNDAPYGIPSTKLRGNDNLHPSQQRRLQSLPSRKPGADEGPSRAIKSAPDNDKPTYSRTTNNYHRHGNGLPPRPGQAIGNSPPHNARSRIADYDSGADLQTKTHGIATRSYEETYLRSNKFATSWARVRADNPTFMENIPGQMVSDKHRDDSQSPGRTPKHQSTGDSSPNRGEPPRSEFQTRQAIYQSSRGRKPFRRKMVKKQKASGSRSPRPYKSAARDENQPPDSNEESGSEEDGDLNEGSDCALSRTDETQGDKKSPRRRPWDESVVVAATNQPPPRLDAKRCKHDLVFKPTVNTNEVVTKAYSGQDDIVIREKTIFDEDLMESDDEDGAVSPGYEYSPRSNDNSPERTGKERMLTRREARMYIKMMNVYGSDAFKNQRKEWFVKRLNEVQEAKSKLEEQQKRQDIKNREEKKDRQARQLNYIREKFRDEQLHRFETQYVTARVLEYEHANRHTYGLPEDYEDLAYLLKDDDYDDDDEDGVNEKDNQNRKENKAKWDPRKNTKRVFKLNEAGQKYNKGKAGKPDKQRIVDSKDNEERQREKAQLARQHQSAWYTQTDASPNRQESPTSHGTSGYESGKSPSEHNGHVDQVSAHDSKPRQQDGLKSDVDQKRKDGRQKVNTGAQNRLDSQKHIYEKRPLNRRKVGPGLHIDNVENRVNQRNDGKEKGFHKATDEDKNAKAKPKDGGEHGIEARDDITLQNKDKMAPVQKNTHTLAKGSLISPSNDRNIGSTPMKKDTENNTESNRNNFPSQRIKSNGKEVGNEERHAQKEAVPPTKEPNKPHSKSKANELEKSSQAENKETKWDKDRENSRGEEPTITRRATNETNKSVPKGKTGDSAKAPNEERTVSKTTDKVTASKTGEPQKQLSKETPDDKSSSRKPRLEDETPPNIKRYPLAGTISKENAPRAFGAAEIILEDKSFVPKKPTTDQNASDSSTTAPVGDAARTKSIPSKERVVKDNVSLSKPAAVVAKVQEPSKTKDVAKGRSAKSVKSTESKTTKPKRNEALADKMFNIKSGPTWNPQAKTPKMEGIDTVVIAGRDSKGRLVKKKRDVDAVVREASNLLKASENTSTDRPKSRLRQSRADSPAVTLGSDFDVDDDFETEDDIFERLRKKYNIKIDSDEEDDSINDR